MSLLWGGFRMKCLCCGDAQNKENIGLTHSAENTFICIHCVNCGVDYSNYKEMKKLSRSERMDLWFEIKYKSERRFKK